MFKHKAEKSVLIIIHLIMIFKIVYTHWILNELHIIICIYNTSDYDIINILAIFKKKIFDFVYMNIRNLTFMR